MSGKKITISVQLAEERCLELTRAAMKREMSKADLVRELIRHYLEEQAAA